MLCLGNPYNLNAITSPHKYDPSHRTFYLSLIVDKNIPFMSQWQSLAAASHFPTTQLLFWRYILNSYPKVEFLHPAQRSNGEPGILGFYSQLIPPGMSFIQRSLLTFSAASAPNGYTPVSKGNLFDKGGFPTQAGFLGHSKHRPTRYKRNSSSNVQSAQVASVPRFEWDTSQILECFWSAFKFGHLIESLVTLQCHLRRQIQVASAIRSSVLGLSKVGRDRNSTPPVFPWTVFQQHTRSCIRWQTRAFSTNSVR